MRAAAVLMVVLYHWKVPVSGALGVIVFFVLSGLLTTGVLIREIKKSGTISIGNFYRRRAFRIFPTFYLCWLVTIGLPLASRPASKGLAGRRSRTSLEENCPTTAPIPVAIARRPMK